MQWPASSIATRRVLRALRAPPSRRLLHDSADTQVPILHIPHSSVFDLGAISSAQPLIRDLSWTIQPGEAWAVIGTAAGSNKYSLFNVLTGNRRLLPLPPNGIFPILQGEHPNKHVSLVGFGHRPASGHSGFHDYTARYGSVRGEDQTTLRQTCFPETAQREHKLALPALHQPHADSRGKAIKKIEKQQWFEELMDRLELTGLLDLPYVALSNGQRRKARIAMALLKKSRVIILDEPLTGLDVRTRALVVSFLHSLHVSPSVRSPHLILGMRGNDPLPDWITHVALVNHDRTVTTGKRDDLIKGNRWWHSEPSSAHIQQASRPLGYELMRMTDLGVSYGPRKVFGGIHWTLHQNARWHLRGANGAGKTTLLAMLTGDHPQSFAQSARLTLFGRARARWTADALAARIGRVSPELHNAFPPRTGLSVWDAVGTGFTGAFVPKGRMRVGLGVEDSAELTPGGGPERWRLRKMWEVLEGLGPRAWAGRVADGSLEAPEDREFAAREYVSLTPGEQSIVLLMRALVGRPPLVLLDEVWAGMDEGQVQAARRYLADGGGGLTEQQACVVISHWEDEVPWGRQDGVRRFVLQDGEGSEVERD
ncbi:P-loop containing nucleoside triphosphate hydrolase protein [Amylocystis lapponica]|nr:P-loop containing nucleoside triphosphate hydrolase protein [Amylocystis lapponica]